MNCLKNYVGIKGYGSAPVSGRYINQLPGISLDSIQKVADKEQVTFLQVFDDVQERSWTRFITDLRNALRRRFQIKTAKTLLHIESADGVETISASAHYRGLLLDSGLDNNGFFAFNVSSISLDLPQAANDVVIKLFDRTGHVLDTFTIASAAEGINTIEVNEAYAASRLFIAVDASAVLLNDTVLGAGNYDQPFAALTGRAAGISGGESLLTSPAFVAQTSSTYGISAIVTPFCDYAHLVCSDRELFIGAWMYLLGAELMQERIYSPRINKYTTIDADEAEKLRDLYTGQYENALDDAVIGIQISADDGCIDCREIVSRVEYLP